MTPRGTCAVPLLFLYNMDMDKIFAIKYIDALYFQQGDQKYTGLKTYVAIGKAIIRENCLILYFREQANGTPIEGLVLPREAIVFEQDNNKVVKNKEVLSYPQKGSDVGIYWTDIVHFENNQMPEEPTAMYTEGKLMEEFNNSVMIEKPKTLKIKGVLSENHPKNIEPELCVIPKSLINDIEVYGNK